MAEEDNVTSKSSAVQHPLAKPRPVPRKRVQPKRDGIMQNEKPEKTPKPVLLPKPRRAPPNAPSIKLSQQLEKNGNVEVPETVNEQSSASARCRNVVPFNTSLEPGNHLNEGIAESGRGNDNLNVENSEDDEQQYQRLWHPKQEDKASKCNSEESYEDKTPSPRAKKGIQPPPLKKSIVTRDSNPPVTPRTAGEASPPITCKSNDTEGKTQPPPLRKITGMGIKLSPQSTVTTQAEIVPDLSPRILDSGNKSKPSPPKKPLPSLPKELSGQSTTNETATRKPHLPQKPVPQIALSSSNGSSQPSVAALAQKLSTITAFQFHEGSSGKAGLFPSQGSSPQISPHSSPRQIKRNQPSTWLSEKSETEARGRAIKTSGPTKSKILPNPGPAEEKAQNIAHDTRRNIPARPSLPSAEAMSRVRSRTGDSLEDLPIASDDSPIQKSNFPKKRLATRKTFQLGESNPSSDSAQAIRRPPPLPPEASLMNKKPLIVKGPPLPAVPRPRPVSSVYQTHSLVVKAQLGKSVSVGGIIPRSSTAEEQSQYSYAYEHASFGANLPIPDPSADGTRTPFLDNFDGAYVAPDENVVIEFMEDLQGKKTEAAYDVLDDEAVTGFMDCVSTGGKQTLDGLTCDLSANDSESSDSDDHEYSEPPLQDEEQDDNDDSDDYEYQQPYAHDNNSDDASSESSFSSVDSSNDYCVPLENVSPPEPPALSKGCDELEGIYAEPVRDLTQDHPISDDDDYSNVEEPLYQVYNRRTLLRERSISRRRLSSDTSGSDEAFLEELARGTLRNMRVLWSELPEVKASGVLDIIKPQERKRQEAMFEVITSEASYLRSLNTLMSRFINSDELSSGSSLCVLERGQSHVLFSNINSVKSVSENFLQALRARQKEAVVISSISDIIEQYATQHFEVYVKYCSNQIYQDRTLKNLRKSERFVEALRRLQSVKEVQGLTLQSFLVLPMQRITRLPLLVNAICQNCEAGCDEFHRTDRALAAVNKLVNNCNEGARKMERMEEICLLQTQVEFKTKPLALATPSRYLLRRGDIMEIVEDTRSPLKKLRPKYKLLYMFLFNDLLLLTKKKSDNRFQVLDYAARNMTQVDEKPLCESSVDHAFSLILLENSFGKTKEFLMAGNSGTDKTRWVEAFQPPTAEREGETVYASWDCPQVNALHNYTAQQPDELSLYEGDVINVLKKLPDGWYHGERLCDGTQGWFPANHTEEIVNEHVRARNLRQRYRLLAASKHLIGGTLKL